MQLTHLYVYMLCKSSLCSYIPHLKLSLNFPREFFTPVYYGLDKPSNFSFQIGLKNFRTCPSYCFALITLGTCDISVIVPTLNEEKYISKCLNSLKNQDFKGGYEVIVVDGGSFDRTMEVAKSLADKTVLLPKAPVGAARNLGVKIAKGDVVAFIDADTIASDQWLNNIQEAFASFDRPVGVTGPTLTYEGGKLDRLAYKIATEWIQKLSLLMGIPHVAGFNCAYLKEPFLKCGGFDENKRLSEDLVLSLKMRSEGRIIYNKNVLAYTSLRRVKHYGYPYLLTFYLMNDIFFFLSNRTLNYHPIR